MDNSTMTIAQHDIYEADNAESLLDAAVAELALGYCNGCEFLTETKTVTRREITYVVTFPRLTGFHYADGPSVEDAKENVTVSFLWYETIEQVAIRVMNAVKELDGNYFTQRRA